MRKQFIFFISFLMALVSYSALKIQDSFPIGFLESFLITLPLFFLMFGSLFISRAAPQVISTKWYQYLSNVGFFVMGVWGTFVLLSLMIDSAKYIFIFIYSVFVNNTLYTEYIVRIFDVINYYKLPVAFIMALVGYIEVLRGPVVKKISVPYKNILPDINNLKIAQISDLHIGTSIRDGYINKVIERTNLLNPDIIVLTGDIIDSAVNSIQSQISLLSKLKARHGVYFITGNHEYYWGIESVLGSLAGTGIKILLNENTIIEINTAKIMLAGITDPAATLIYPAHKPNIEKTAATDSNVDFKILLAHQPNIYNEAVKNNFDLQLSGHTHGGQFFPFNFFVPLVHKYYRGLQKHDNLYIYVNPGTGYWGPMNRFGIPAEITLLTLIKL